MHGKKVDLKVRDKSARSRAEFLNSRDISTNHGLEARFTDGALNSVGLDALPQSQGSESLILVSSPGATLK